MTAIVEAPQPGAEAIASPQAAVVAIMAADVQIAVVLDAHAPISVMIDPLLKVVNTRLRELGVAPLEAKGRGRWMLCLVDGTPLRPNLSLTEQEVYDGDRLWLKFLEDTEHRSEVIEHISTAVATNLSKRFAPIDPVVAVQVGATMVAVGVLLGSALLGWWRWQHESWLPAPFAAVIAVLVLTVATMILARSKTVPDRRVGDILLLSGLVPLAVAIAATARTGWRAARGAGLRGVRCRRDAGHAVHRPPIGCLHGAGDVVRRRDSRRSCPDGAADQRGDAADLRAAGLCADVPRRPALSRWLSGIRLPVFPSATSRWVFEARPDLPTTVVVSGGGQPTLEGPPRCAMCCCAPSEPDRF
ncbi:type VII secretion integral membrane protein EccD [Mycobacterium xenopi 3993]|nr:type VII secretion integral membrane protein EccD [Mycobacterium xenopi 3993]